jgi:hypothetical protein
MFSEIYVSSISETYPFYVMHTKEVQLRDHLPRPVVCIPKTFVDKYIAFIHVAPRVRLFLRSHTWLR